jgi:CheY-like chemotaxis protein/anti-sigma regulatory factor (Ser/Thr protein kinase)
MRSSFNAVLDISRLESGFVKAEYSQFEIHALVEEILPAFNIIAARRNVRLAVRYSRKGQVIVRSDRHLLSRVISNLVSNALTYSDPQRGDKAKVLVALIASPGRARLEVIDNGLGIPRDQWKEVFRPFVQLHNPERDREKGVGLGLSIVNAIIQLLSAHSIEMNSIKGRGTRVSLSLPRAYDEDVAESIETDGITTNIHNEASLYVLYVEDDNHVRRSTLAIFEAYNILYEAVASFRELKELLPRLERVPDIVITDYRLPENYTALDVVMAIKKATEVDVPVIVLTGEVLSLSDEQRITFKTVLRKPVTPGELLQAMSQLATPLPSGV